MVNGRPGRRAVWEGAGARLRAWSAVVARSPSRGGKPSEQEVPDPTATNTTASVTQTSSRPAKRCDSA